MSQPKIIDMEIQQERIPVTALAKAEIDTQIATAKQYPRDLPAFEAKTEALIESHMALAKKPEEGLHYALPRGGKIIQGPNARFAEIIASSWGNLRISRDLISEETSHVVCEAICHDLESNNAERVRVRRRITNRDGHRYDDDMITVTANAGASIARRNAVLAVIPKSQWWPLYERALALAGGGTKKEVSANAKSALAHFESLKVSEAQVLAVLGAKKAADLTPEHVATLRGIAAAIKSGETTAAQAFHLGEPAARSSRVKEKPQASGPVSNDQMGQIYSLVIDLNIESTDVGKMLETMGHKGGLAKLPAARLPELIEGLERLAKL